ncbi:MAG: succinylglutamate desuccinylase [Deltaproteobacteria bacterium]|nr:MAG: succinylglutamate desuccinylase [Deltaproteobacteria bacterium]
MRRAGGGAIASKADRPAPFSFAGAEVKPGRAAEFEIPVARLPAGTWVTMPTVVVHGRHKGPRVWLNAAIHGDELNGVEIIRQVLAAVDASRMCGTVIAVPIVNVFGVITGTRYLPDRRDLNRSFPGSRRGSLAARLAHLFFAEVVSRCEFGIDYHTGSAGRDNLPQIRCDADDEVVRDLACAFAPPIVVHANVRDGSLRAAANADGKRVLLYEAGEALRFDERAIELGVAGTLRVLAALGMVPDGAGRPAQPPPVSRKTAWVRASRSGFCHLAVDRGHRVSAGDIVARIADTHGRRTVPVRTKLGGVVIGCLRTAVVHRGEAVVHIAEVAA